jgi:hypothetical protein
LNKNDLFIIPDDIHVEFYLYGAVEMRQGVENILREGRLIIFIFLNTIKMELLPS